MKSVSYDSFTQLDCKCNMAIVLCVAPEITAHTTSYIFATIAFVDSVFSAQGTVYRYAFAYDEAQLLDPAYSLVPCDINNVLCNSCLLDYINQQVASTTVKFAGIGTTAQRPVLGLTNIGTIYLDTTLDTDGLPIMWTGLKWISLDAQGV